MPGSTTVFQSSWNKVKRFISLHPEKIFLVLVFLLFGIVSFAHLFQLDSVPTGMFRDETSIGYNAALLAKTGMDEHGARFPIYFKAFGEYKNPIFIYAATLIFKILGVSEFNLRLTGFVFFMMAFVLTFFLVSKIFKKNKLILIYFVLSFGFLPQFFTISRIAFEAISQLALVSAALLLVYVTFVEREANSRIDLGTIASGFILGLSVYTYTTARVLSFLLLASLWVFFFRRASLKKLIAVTAAFALSLIPFALFAINTPGALTSRFGAISYITANIPVTKKIIQFVINTVAYWSPDFLIRSGDPNLRHSSGYGGIVFGITLFLFLLGMIVLLVKKHFLRDRFQLFLVTNLIFSPLGAILTSEGTPHALRSLLFGYFLLLISCFGLKLICELKLNEHRWKILTAVLVLLAIEITGYQVNYFVVYPSKSVLAMGGYDMEASLQKALDENPKAVLYPDKPSDFYPGVQFYSLLVKNPKNIPIRMTTSFKPVTGSCVIYPIDVEFELEHFSDPYIELESKYPVNSVEKLFQVQTPTTPIHVRCYKSPE